AAPAPRLRLPTAICGFRAWAATSSWVIALFPDDDLAAQEWVQAADAAVYLAKRQGRNRFAFSRRWRGRVWRFKRPAQLHRHSLVA
ncbi:MAG: hypothetical protein Q8R98_08860, partial [Rubrivivax sp.]|nr:hypothetical protein [Rubrivivax sp.]